MQGTPFGSLGLLLVPIGGFIAWRLYRRVRSHVGAQPVRPRSMGLRAVWLAAAAVALLLLPRQVEHAQAAELGGLLAGAAVAAVSLRLTRFETRAEGRFYTPNVFIGTAISLLLIGRLLYRFAQLYEFEQAAAAGGAAQVPQSAAMASPQTPATMALLGLFLGYYIVYNAGVLWRSRRPAA